MRISDACTPKFSLGDLYNFQSILYIKRIFPQNEFKVTMKASSSMITVVDNSQILKRVFL